MRRHAAGGAGGCGPAQRGRQSPRACVAERLVAAGKHILLVSGRVSLKSCKGAGGARRVVAGISAPTSLGDGVCGSQRPDARRISPRGPLQCLCGQPRAKPMKIAAIYLSPGHNFSGVTANPRASIPSSRFLRRMFGGAAVWWVIVFSTTSRTTRARSPSSRGVYDELQGAATRRPHAGGAAADVLTRGGDLNALIGQEFELQACVSSARGSARPVTGWSRLLRRAPRRGLKGRGACGRGSTSGWLKVDASC